MLRALTLPTVLLTCSLAAIPDPVAPDPKTPRPIDAVASIWMEDLTWMEIRDQMQSGTDTVIVATGGVEQNGPYLITNKHQVVLRGTMEAIARKLGKALVAPLVAFVPEGDIDPPSLHMKYPGTISLTEATYQALLTDICASLKTSGFKRIILLGDSGGNQAGMKLVAEQLNAAWGGKPKIVLIPEYYQFYTNATKWAEAQGIQQVPEGLHDDYVMTAQMLSVDPKSVRMEQRIKAGKFTINGVDLAPAAKTIEFGRKVIDYRATETVKLIKERG